MVPGSGSQLITTPPYSQIIQDSPAGLHETGCGNLEKVLEEPELPQGCWPRSALLGSQWALWSPDSSETHALFKEGKPTQNNCQANRQRKPLVSPEVPRKAEAQEHAAAAEVSQRCPFCQLFFWLLLSLLFFGRRDGTPQKFSVLLKGLIFTCSIMWDLQPLPFLCAVMFYCSLSFCHEET